MADEGVGGCEVDNDCERECKEGDAEGEADRERARNVLGTARVRGVGDKERVMGDWEAFAFNLAPPFSGVFGWLLEGDGTGESLLAREAAGRTAIRSILEVGGR